MELVLAGAVPVHSARNRSTRRRIAEHGAGERQFIGQLERGAGLDEAVNPVPGVLVNLAQELLHLRVRGFQVRAIPNRARVAPLVDVVPGLGAPDRAEAAPAAAHTEPPGARQPSLEPGGESASSRHTPTEGRNR